jgi:hypothetical protein
LGGGREIRQHRSACAAGSFGNVRQFHQSQETTRWNVLSLLSGMAAIRRAKSVGWNATMLFVSAKPVRIEENIMSIKVVYNACFGGFSLSRKACERLVELGRDKAQKELELGNSYEYNSYCRDISRHDPLLVQVVEELGDEASGSCAELCITEEYDGRETVEEPGYDRGGWVSIK